MFRRPFDGVCMQNINVKAEIPTVNIEVAAGNRTRFEISVFAEGKPYDLTRSKFVFKVKTADYKTVDWSGYITASGSVLVIDIPAAATVNAFWSRGDFDVFDASTETTLFKGVVKLIDTVSKVADYKINLQNVPPRGNVELNLSDAVRKVVVETVRAELSALGKQDALPGSADAQNNSASDSSGQQGVQDGGAAVNAKENQSVNSSSQSAQSSDVSDAAFDEVMRILKG